MWVNGFMYGDSVLLAKCTCDPLMNYIVICLLLLSCSKQTFCVLFAKHTLQDSGLVYVAQTCTKLTILKVVKSGVLLLGNYHIHNDTMRYTWVIFWIKNILSAEGVSIAIHITKQKQLRSIFLFPALIVQN